MRLIKLDWEHFEQEANSAGILLPIEQTRVWASYQAVIPGRKPWGSFALKESGSTMALVSFIDYETHGYHYLRSHHGPAWAATPTPAQEAAALDAIAAYVREHERKHVFVRLAVMADLQKCQPVLSSLPYDATVIVDLAGGDEEILARMKPRGRRDVRKALRECNCEFADETDNALESFAEYYAVMVDTGLRDGFALAPESDYTEMLRRLGPSCCRLYVARSKNDNAVVSWEMDTISGTRAVRYYAATANGPGRNHVADALVYFALCELARRGCKDMDLMAIGSDFSPQLKGLNEFKCKFAKEITAVAPDRDLPLRSFFYKMLQKARIMQGLLRQAPGTD